MRSVAGAVVAGLGLAATVSCAPAAVPITPGPTTTESSQVPTSSAPSSRAATSAGSLNDQLVAAAWADDVPTATRLIKAGADVNYLSSTTESAFSHRRERGVCRAA